MKSNSRSRLAGSLALMLLVGGCPESPEASRTRGGGPGADAGNYESKPIDVPSKIDGTKVWESST